MVSTTKSNQDALLMNFRDRIDALHLNCLTDHLTSSILQLTSAFHLYLMRASG